MPEPDREVTIRRLPDGESQPAIERSLAGALLLLELPPSTAGRPFGLGTLVEVASSSTLYLGEVQGWHDLLLSIAVEHAVDREALAAIQRIWQPPDQPRDLPE